MKFDFETVAAAMREVAETEILPRWQHLKEGDITEKTGPDDIVTVADRAAEKAIGAKLMQLYPGTDMVGEEGVTADPARMELFNTDKPLWVIDPIDGTMGFATGSPQFDIMVALVQNKQLLGGWIYAPVDKRMVMGGKGTGVFENGKRCPKARSGLKLNELTGVLGKKFFPEDIRNKLFSKAGDFKKLINTVCAGHDYEHLLCGDADFAIYNKIMPWDHLPGLALAEELGFYYAKWDGTPYIAGDTAGGLLIAPDAQQWGGIRKILLGA